MIVGGVLKMSLIHSILMLDLISFSFLPLDNFYVFCLIQGDLTKNNFFCL